MTRRLITIATSGQDAQPGTILVVIGDDGTLTADAFERCDGEFVNAP